MDAEQRLRSICLALPEAQEKETWEAPTFRVRDRIFAMVRRDNALLSVWMKAPDGAQEVLVGADPKRFFRPPYLGHRGWIGVRLDDGPDWEEVAVLVRRSFLMTAPKKLSKQLEPPPCRDMPSDA